MSASKGLLAFYDYGMVDERHAALLEVSKMKVNCCGQKDELLPGPLHMTPQMYVAQVAPRQRAQ